MNLAYTELGEGHSTYQETDAASSLRLNGGGSIHANLIQTLGSHHPRNAPDDNLIEAYQCHGTNVGPMGTIRSGNGNETGGVPFVIGFTKSSDPNNWCEEMVPPITARHGDPGNIANSLRGEGFDASEDGTGRGTPLVPVAFAQNSRDEVREIEGSIAGALSAQPGMKQQTVVAFKESQSGVRVGDVHATLDSNKVSRRMEGVMSGFGARRLMPIECERCQGMPDDFTRYGITEDGKEVELSDSARYRLIGNSVAVPCVEWIGRRLADA